VQYSVMVEDATFFALSVLLPQGPGAAARGTRAPTNPAARGKLLLTERGLFVTPSSSPFTRPYLDASGQPRVTVLH